MNCELFQDRLHEYVDGSLSVPERAAAGQHLAGCPACRQTLQNEQKLALALSGHLQQGVGNVKLSAALRSKILSATSARPTQPSVAELFVNLWIRYAWSSAMAVSLLVLVGILVFNHFNHTNTRGHKATLAQTEHSDISESSASVSIEYSTRQPVYSFHREGGLVIDTVSFDAVAASNILPSRDLETQETKNSL